MGKKTELGITCLMFLLLKFLRLLIVIAIGVVSFSFLLK